MSWVKLDDGMPDSLKIAPLSDAAFRAYVTSICYAARNLTDGFIPLSKAKSFAGRSRTFAELMPHLWELAKDGVKVHDYLAYNPTRDEVLASKAEFSEARSKAGKAGAAKRWQTDSKSHGKPIAKAMANEWQTDSPVPDPVPDPHPELKLPLEPPPPPKTIAAKPRRRELTEDDLITFREDHPNLDVGHEAAKYRDWCLAKGNPHKDQLAGFRNWLREAEDRAKTRRDTAGTDPRRGDSTGKIAAFAGRLRGAG